MVNKIHLAAKCILDHLPKDSKRDKQLRREIEAEDSFYQRVDDYARSLAWRRFIADSVYPDNIKILEAGFNAMAYDTGRHVEEFIVLLSVEAEVPWHQIANHFISACNPYYDDKDS